MYKENTLMNRTLTRRIAFSEQFDLFVGVDLGKATNIAVIINRRLKRYGRFKFTHSRQDYDKFAAWLKQNRAGVSSPRVLVGMEPTNDYWQWLADYLKQAGIPYRLVNSFTVKKYREGTQLDYAKNDDRDAQAISQLLTQGQFTETQLLPEPYAQMRQYEQTHWKLSAEIRREKTLLRQHAERLFPELRQVFGDFTGMTAVALLQNHADPKAIAALSWPTFESRVRQDLTGKRLMVKKVRLAYDLAPNSIGGYAGDALQRLIQQHLATLRHLQQQLTAVETELLACFHTLPMASYLLSLGLGEVATALIAAELGDLNQFRHPKQLVKLAGIQPTPNQSGFYEREATPMSQKGRPRLRTYLFFGTMRLVRWDDAFRARKQAFVNRSKNPLKPIEAIGALMNKLLHLVWAVCRQETAYSPERFMAG
jgi:transposase